MTGSSTQTRTFALSGAAEGGRTIETLSLLKGGRYELIDVLADGGMGVIFRARDHRVGGNVVLIKAVKYDASVFGYDRQAALYHVYAMRQRFKREKNVLAEMARRNLNAVPSLNDFFYDRNPELWRAYPFGHFAPHHELDISGQRQTVAVDSEPYLVMERIFGRNLRDSQGELSPERFLVVAQAVCRILEVIHADRVRDDGSRLSFIYMDLKPDNLVIDGLGGVTLVDFGAAVPIVDGRRNGKGAYTPGFAAPEVRRISHPAAVVDGRADLYSLGAILYWGLSSGHVDPMGLARSEEDFPVLDLSRLMPGLPVSVRSIVERALAREPEDRFASAAEMRAAIEDALREL